MKHFVLRGLLAASIVLTYGSMSWAAEGAVTAPATPPASKPVTTPAPAKPAAPVTANAIKATLTGTNYTPEKSLLGKTGAVCNTEACRSALKIDEAKDEKGAPIPNLKGATVFYLYSDAAKSLWSDKANADKALSVTGTLYLNERTIDVKNFTLAPAAAPKSSKSDDDFKNFQYTPNNGSASSRIKSSQ